MSRCITILALLLTQLLAPAMSWRQAVLCVHPDGSAFVESPSELLECHGAASKSDDAGVSEQTCRDFAFPNIGQIAPTVSLRSSGIQFAPQPYPIPFSPLDYFAQPIARLRRNVIIEFLGSSDAILASLSTVILTV